MATSPLARLSNLDRLLSFEKDRQRDLLDMTVFCFRWCAVQKRTVRKAVSMPSYRKLQTIWIKQNLLMNQQIIGSCSYYGRCIVDSIEHI